MVGLAGIGSAKALTQCGQTVVGAMRKDPSRMGLYIGLSALPSSQGLYGFIGYFFASPLISPEMTIQVALAILILGFLLGIVGFATATYQAKILSNAIVATADGHNVTATAMVMAVFPELYAILALLVALLTFMAF